MAFTKNACSLWMSVRPVLLDPGVYIEIPLKFAFAIVYSFKESLGRLFQNWAPQSPRLAQHVFTVVGKTTHGLGIIASQLLVREDHIALRCFVESLEISASKNGEGRTVCICVYIIVYTCMYIYRCTDTHTHTHIYIYIHIKSSHFFGGTSISTLFHHGQSCGTLSGDATDGGGSNDPRIHGAEYRVHRLVGGPVESLDS